MADQFFGITDTGKQRDNNEDTFIAQRTAKGNFVIAAVIDGVGGYSGGEVAAELARESFLKSLNKPSGNVTAALANSFNEANEHILKHKQEVEGHSHMACVATIAFVDIDNNQFYYAHVGDTRLYLLRDQSLVKITEDHSFVGFLEDSGRITEEAAMTHPKRNEINKALGFEGTLSSKGDYIQTGQSPFLPGDMLLLCSDGLTDMVNKQDITDILTVNNPLKEKGKLLIELANQNGGRDNITVVLVENNNAGGNYEATMPVSVSKKNIDEVASTHEPDGTSTTVKSNTNIAVPILVILMLLFLGSTIWLYLQRQNPVQHIDQPKADTLAQKPQNEQEIKLEQAIAQLKGHVLVLDTTYKSPIVISKAININNDSLLIKAKGDIVLQSDSAYIGPAFMVSPNSKSLQLDSLTFRNFQVGVVSANIVVALKNVRFNNCKTAVQVSLKGADKKYITGKITPLLLRADSLPVKVK